MARSSIAKLDPGIRAELDRLLKDDRYTIDQVTAHLRDLGAQVSRSAVGRYHQRFEEIGKRMRESREVAKVWADRLGNEPQGDIGKLVMELLRTMAFDATLELQDARDEEGKPTLDPKSINTLALAMQRLEAAGKWNLEREKTMRDEALKQAADTAAKIARKGGLSVSAVDEIRRQILGMPE
ncbi:DUF3486 family protein [Polycyclovorans algicola]|uniref:DUF3486 family protein n=1 Tax=Polycyclovorans algicola TaxID=616992 RepID=UPI0004A6CDA0|nr:DUF3486 family protein [Polycyclovorans algicola]